MTAKQTKKKAILYARFSPRPHAKDTVSLKFQIDQCRRFAIEQGYEVMEITKDERISGKGTNNRLGFQKAIETAIANKATIIVYSLSRFARSTRDAILYADKLRAAGADLISLKEYLDTSTPMGKFFFTVVAALAELERNLIAERTKDAISNMKGDRKLYTHPDKLPFGMQINPDDPKKLINNPDEQKVIRHILEEYSRTHSYAETARRCTRDRIPKRTPGKPWHVNEIRRIVLANKDFPQHSDLVIKLY